MTARLNDAAVVLWRGEGTVQLELGPKRVVVENITDTDLLNLLPERYSRARRRGTDGSTDTRRGGELLGLLDECGLLEHGPQNGPHAGQPEYLRAERAALRTHTSDAEAVLRRRAQTAIEIRGASRITVPLAVALAAAGVGELQLSARGDVTAPLACPGGLAPDDEGRRFLTAAREAVTRSAPNARVEGSSWDRTRAMVVLTDCGPADPTLAAALVEEGTPHLVASADTGQAVIGPLVVPGRTSCVRCADLARSDRDPAWPLLAMQLNERSPARTAPDTALCIAAAGVAAGQILAWLDGTSPDTLNGTLEWLLPDWRLRRRTWLPHPRCSCGAVGVRDDLDAGGRQVGERLA